MNQTINEITINGKVYVEKSSVSVTPLNDKQISWNGVVFNRNGAIMNAESLDGMPYVIIRTYSAGVHAGYLKSRTGKEVTLLHARRIWYWEGAASLSQLATDGTSKPDKCKFPCEVSQIELTESIEVLQCTQKAKDSIQNVKIWQA